MERNTYIEHRIFGKVNDRESEFYKRNVVKYDFIDYSVRPIYFDNGQPITYDADMVEALIEQMKDLHSLTKFKSDGINLQKDELIVKERFRRKLERIQTHIDLMLRSITRDIVYQYEDYVIKENKA